MPSNLHTQCDQAFLLLAPATQFPSPATPFCRSVLVSSPNPSQLQLKLFIVSCVFVVGGSFCCYWSGHLTRSTNQQVAPRPQREGVTYLVFTSCIITLHPSCVMTLSLHILMTLSSFLRFFFTSVCGMKVNPQKPNVLTNGFWHLSLQHRRDDTVVTERAAEWRPPHVDRCFSMFVRPQPGKFFFHKTRVRSQQIYS